MIADTPTPLDTHMLDELHELTQRQRQAASLFDVWTAISDVSLARYDAALGVAPTHEDLARYDGARLGRIYRWAHEMHGAGATDCIVRELLDFGMREARS